MPTSIGEILPQAPPVDERGAQEQYSQQRIHPALLESSGLEMATAPGPGQRALQCAH